MCGVTIEALDTITPRARPGKTRKVFALTRQRGMVGSLSILQFAGIPGLGIAHLGGISGGVRLEGHDDLGACAGAFEQLRAFPLGSKRSEFLLRGLAGVGAQ
jgi:hypothetical protein